jgi:hypothetical protein
MDWMAESARMSDTYQNRVCTVAVLSASNGDEGCFKRRNPLPFLECVIPIPETDDLRIRRNWESHRRRGYVPNRTGTRQPALQRRVWVVQERLLSPRTLYYGLQESTGSVDTRSLYLSSSISVCTIPTIGLLQVP